MERAEGLAIIDERDELERAVERLLVWGFSPECIAEQTGCTIELVERVCMESAYSNVDVDDVVLRRVTA